MTHPKKMQEILRLANVKPDGFREEIEVQQCPPEFDVVRNLPSNFNPAVTDAQLTEAMDDFCGAVEEPRR